MPSDVVFLVVIVGIVFAGSLFSWRHRVNRGSHGSNNAHDHERTEALRQISRDIDRGRDAGRNQGSHW